MYSLTIENELFCIPANLIGFVSQMREYEDKLKEAGELQSSVVQISDNIRTLEDAACAAVVEFQSKQLVSHAIRIDVI